MSEGIVGVIANSKSASFRALNSHLLRPSVKVSQAFPVAKSQPRIRQNSAGLNKTEQAFFDWLTVEAGPLAQVYTQAITLRIANGSRYTPDFVARAGIRFAAYEVKGFLRDDAAVKLKVAASLYPWIKFHLVTKRKGGGWDVQEVLA